MSTVRSADGTTIAYTRAGQGPPLILVDGALCSRSFGPMPKLAEQLTPHFTVYTYDRRGRGESGDNPPYEPGREVEDLEALTALAGDAVYLHGTSSGAVLALEAAKHIRSVVKLAVLVFPVVLGGGKHLFSEADKQIPLTLTGSEAFSTGVVHLTYEPGAR
jgi:pimeloyl-ACP methyl ester carboxylesterase